jgi:hypothetical protein
MANPVATLDKALALLDTLLGALACWAQQPPERVHFAGLPSIDGS